MFWLLTCLLVFSSDDPVKSDMDALQGTWFAVRLQNEEIQAPLDAIKQFKLTIKGQQMTFATEGIKETRIIGFKIDPSHKPATIDLVTLTGPENGQTLPGIYKLEGDILTICLPTKRNEKKEYERPTSFDPKKSSNLGLFVVKKKVN